MPAESYEDEVKQRRKAERGELTGEREEERR